MAFSGCRARDVRATGVTGARLVFAFAGDATN